MTSVISFRPQQSFGMHKSSTWKKLQHSDNEHQVL